MFQVNQLTGFGNVTTEFPVIAATSTTQSENATNPHTINLPSGIVSGDVLLLAIQYKGRDRTISSLSQSWNTITNNNNSGVGERRTYILWRLANGTEGTTTTMTLDSSTDFVASVCYRIQGAQSVEGGVADDSGFNPPSLTPSWGSAKTLWVVFFGTEGNESSLTYPANYTLSQINRSGKSTPDATGQQVWFGARQLETATEDPAAGTLSDTNPIVQTIAIRPR